VLEIVKVGKALLGAESGAALLLFFLCGVASWAYWRERRRNNEIQEERLADAREDVKVMTEALTEAKNATEGFKNTLEVVAIHLREGVPCPYGHSNPPKGKEP
jgi:cbb3-type cytochrome oxidase subunit 3